MPAIISTCLIAYIVLVYSFIVRLKLMLWLASVENRYRVKKAVQATHRQPCDLYNIDYIKSEKDYATKMAFNANVMQNSVQQYYIRPIVVTV